MDWAGPFFVIAIIVVCAAGAAINNWIRAKHGYPLENDWGGTTKREDDGSKAELQRENAALRTEVKTVHDRVAVLERIVTDKGYGLADEIEALRDASDAGVPLDSARFVMRKKERN